MKRYYIICLLFIIFSCSKDDNEKFEIAEKTVIVYMAADNNLYRNAESDIREMMECEIPEGCNLAVYVDAPLWTDVETPQLFEIRSGKLIPIKRYESHNSAGKEIVRQVIGDVMNNFRAKTYDLILWSHGTGWLPANVFNSLTKSFGREDDSEIEITDLANVLPDRFECMIFDACLMGGIEVYYQLRNKADIIIASPTETLVAGLPYDKIIPLLFAVSPDYAKIADEYMSYYKNQAGALQSATISVVATKHLQTLAGLLNDAVVSGKVDKVHDRDKIQKYDLLENSIFYDFMDCVGNTVDSESHIAAIERQLSKIVIYNDFTSRFLDKFEIVNSCGISIYVSHKNQQLDEAYRQLDWYIDSGCQINESLDLLSEAEKITSNG
jgi:hypothetical protein